MAEQCCPYFTPGSYAFDTCDLELGAGVREPHGGSASNMDCGMPAGRRYMRGDDANLEDMFACVAQVGVSGNFAEFPIEGAVRSLETFVEWAYYARRITVDAPVRILHRGLPHVTVRSVAIAAREPDGVTTYGGETVP